MPGGAPGSEEGIRCASDFTSAGAGPPALARCAAPASAPYITALPAERQSSGEGTSVPAVNGAAVDHMLSQVVLESLPGLLALLTELAND